MSRFLLAVLVGLFGIIACQKKSGESKDSRVASSQEAFQGVWIHKVSDKCFRSFAVKEDVYTFENGCLDGENKTISEIESGRIVVSESQFILDIRNHSCPDRAFTASPWRYTIVNSNSLSISFSGGQTVFAKMETANLPSQSVSVTYGCFDKDGQFTANPAFKL